MRVYRFQLNPTVRLLALAVLCSTGCGSSGDPVPELAEVTGTVMYEGQPVEGAIVSFSPVKAAETGSARASTGGTDATGAFTLFYNADYSGAILGEHVVSISKLGGTDEAPGDETLPLKYNLQTTLKETVRNDQPNEFHFDLKK